jgi:signal transduction histidine kinase
MRPRRLSSQFILLLAVGLAVVLAVALLLTLRIASFPARAERLIFNLEQTTALNYRILHAIHGQGVLISRQFEHLDPDFPQRLAQANFDLGHAYTDYLKLPVDQPERLAVERIKADHGELTIKGMHVYSALEAGREAKAAALLDEVAGLADQIDQDFRLINGLQLLKLRQVLDELTTTVEVGRLAVVSLAALAVGTLVLFTFLLRGRVLRRLEALSGAVDRLRHGDFSVRAEVGADDEIGGLARGFNFMADSLAESYGVLEQRVEERTRQVEALQERVVQAAKMSALGQLVSGVAHELNNPLTVIYGYAELLRGDLAERGGEGEAVGMLDDVLSQAERCRKIVEGLAQFVRPQRAERRRLRLRDLVERVLSLREYQLRTRNIRVIREFAADEPEVHGDPHKLEQVVLNLVNNAHDAVVAADGSGGTIRIGTRPTADGVELEVTDDGGGIAEPERVFEPFYTTKEEGQGMGMGLAVSYGIVREHGGEIHADNVAGGARVTVSLPLGTPEAASQAAPEPLAPTSGAGRQRRVLVVEDEEMLRRLQESYLSAHGFQVETAASGHQAVEVLAQRPVDLIVSDVRMPGDIDGLGLYHWVEKHRPELAGRFLFVSGDLIALETAEFFQRHRVPCIQKPFTREDYARLVYQVLEGA